MIVFINLFVIICVTFALPNVDNINDEEEIWKRFYGNSWDNSEEDYQLDPILAYVTPLDSNLQPISERYLSNLYNVYTPEPEPEPDIAYFFYDEEDTNNHFSRKTADGADTEIIFHCEYFECPNKTHSCDSIVEIISEDGVQVQITTQCLSITNEVLFNKTSISSDESSGMYYFEIQTKDDDEEPVASNEVDNYRADYGKSFSKKELLKVESKENAESSENAESEENSESQENTSSKENVESQENVESKENTSASENVKAKKSKKLNDYGHSFSKEDEEEESKENAESQENAESPETSGETENTSASETVKANDYGHSFSKEESKEYAESPETSDEPETSGEQESLKEFEELNPPFDVSKEEVILHCDFLTCPSQTHYCKSTFNIVSEDLNEIEVITQCLSITNEVLDERKTIAKNPVNDRYFFEISTNDYEINPDENIAEATKEIQKESSEEYDEEVLAKIKEHEMDINIDSDLSQSSEDSFENIDWANFNFTMFSSESLEFIDSSNETENNSNTDSNES